MTIQLLSPVLTMTEQGGQDSPRRRQDPGDWFHQPIFFSWQCFWLALTGWGQVKIFVNRSIILTRFYSRMGTTFYHYPDVKIEKSEKTRHPNIRGCECLLCNYVTYPKYAH